MQRCRPTGDHGRAITKTNQRSPDDRSDVDLRRSDAAGKVAVAVVVGIAIAGKVHALFGSKKKMSGRRRHPGRGRLASQPAPWGRTLWAQREGRKFPLAASPLAYSSSRMLGGSSRFAIRKVTSLRVDRAVSRLRRQGRSWIHV